MAQSTNLRASNEAAHKAYMTARTAVLGNSAFRDGSPGLVNPFHVQDNTIMLLVETGVFRDNEHANQPAQSDYTVVKKDKIGIRYLEIADDSIAVTCGEVNGGVFNGYGRKPASHDRPDPQRVMYYSCSSLGGKYDYTNKVWKLWNVEFSIYGSLATDHEQLAYYQIQPAHDYGYFKNLVMNDWCDATVPVNNPNALNAAYNITGNYLGKAYFPKTQYAPVREIIVHGSKMSVINLNCMQYVYFIYIAGYISLNSYKAAGCAVLQQIGSLGLYGPLLPATVALTADARCMERAFVNDPNLQNSPGIGDNLPSMHFDEMFSSSGLTSAPWIDLAKARFANTLFYHTQIRGALPAYHYDMIFGLKDFCANTNITSVPPINAPVLTDISGGFQNCGSLTGSLEITAPKLTNLNTVAIQCAKLTSFKLLGGAQPTSMIDSFRGTTALTDINAFDTSKVGDATRAFTGTGLTRLPSFNFQSAVSVASIFNNSKLTTIPPMNFSKAVTTAGAYGSCMITTIPQIITTGVLTDTSTMFSYNSNLGGTIDNIANTTPATHASFDTRGVTNASRMFISTNLTRIELNLARATNISEICKNCKSLTAVSFKVTDGVLNDISGMYEGCSKARWDNLNVSGWTSAITDASYAYANVDWNSPDNTGTVMVSLPKATDITQMLAGVHGRQWIKFQNMLPTVRASSIFGPVGTYNYNQFPARKLWILNRTAMGIFNSWKDLVTRPSLASATFEITLESVSNLDPKWLDSMVRLTKITFINEPLDFQATAGLWVAAHSFKTNPLLTEINLQGSMTPEFIKALQVVAPPNVNYTGNITILHHNDLAWT